MTKRDKDIDPNSPAVIREGQMQLLAEIGGKLLGEEDITFSGTKFVLPAKLDLDQSIEFLEQRRNDEETVNRFVKEFNYRPLDGARATAQAIKEAFGFTLGKTLYSFFGNTPPTFIDVRFGPGRDDTEQVPWGAMQIPGFANTTVYLGNSSHPELGLIFQIRVEGPRKYRWHFEGLFRLIERNLRENSIYRGKAIDGAESPNFLDTTSINPDDVVYTREVLAQLEANVWSPIKHADVLDKLGQPGKHLTCLLGEKLPIQQFVGARGHLQFGGRGHMSAVGIEPWQECLERLGRASRPAATMHQRRVARDLVHPGAKLRLAAERCQVTVDLQEGLLQHVGRVRVAGEAARQAKDASLIPLHDRLEGRVVTGRCARGQRLVARFRRGDDHGCAIY